MQKKSPGQRSKRYRVGKGCPPLTTRWKPGQSGNLRGRPKGSRNIGKILRDVTERKIPVTENGKTRWMSAFEVMLRRLVNDAMQNNQGALKLVFSLMDRNSDWTEAVSVPQIDEVLAEDQEILARYLGTPSGTATEPAKGSDSEEH